MEDETGSVDRSTDREVRAFLAEHEARVAPLARRMALARWEATTTGESAHYTRAAELEVELRRIYADPDDFARLQAWSREGGIRDPLLARQVELLTLAYTEHQIPGDLMERMVALDASINESFHTFRGRIPGAGTGPGKGEGEEVTANEILEILRQEVDSERRRAAWEASKQVGPVVEEELLELVRLRNEAARSLGYTDYYQMRMTLTEHDPATIEALFEELDRLTREPFVQAKAELDAGLAARFGVTPDRLRPWHYADPFFQEPPGVGEVDLDALYARQDLVALATDFFGGIGLPVEDILERSDLYERPGKDQSAFCTDIDREGDVRILTNLQPTMGWMDTLLHELGHAVYDKYIDPELPFALRTAAHAFVTEGVALWFGRLAKDEAWIRAMVSPPPALLEEADLGRTTRDVLRLQMLVFARWSLVMVNFERALYADPEQDLHALWWDLVERYQGLTRPEGRDAPDWATKIHFVIVPVYYHNYLMGELFASQLQAALLAELGEPQGADLTGRPEVGAFFRNRVFQHGKRVPWEQLVERATGQPLGPEAFVRQFVDVEAAGTPEPAVDPE